MKRNFNYYNKGFYLMQGFKNIIKEITNQALEEIIKQKEIPRVAAGFEVQFSSFKENYQKLWLYIQKFKPEEITNLYKSREVESRIFVRFVKCFIAVQANETNTKITVTFIQIHLCRLRFKK